MSLKKYRRRFFCRADGWQDLTQGIKLRWTASRALVITKDELFVEVIG